MSYTAPQYVDTKEQAILALASTIKGEAVTGGDGSVNRALDILADVLAESDVQVPQTDAGAILALAQYVSGGVGGGDSTTQTLTVTKGNADDTVSVSTIGWADYIAKNVDALVEVQPDSTEGLASVYSIPVGTAFIARISDMNVAIFLDAEMTVNVNTAAMPSTPLYARLPY